MKIKSIKIKNFYSFESAFVDFSKFKNIILIKGHNKDVAGSNGSGKSAFVEAIYFGLTGKTIRKSTEDAIVHVKHKKQCAVTLTLDNGVVIYRQKKPSKLQVFVDEEEKTQESILKTQEFIDGLLKINSMITEFTQKINQIKKAKKQFAGYDDSILTLSLENILEAEDKQSTRAWKRISLARQLDDVVAQISKIKEHLNSPPKKGTCDKCGQRIEEALNKSFLTSFSPFV